MPVNITDWITTDISCSTAESVEILRERILPLLKELLRTEKIKNYFDLLIILPNLIGIMIKAIKIPNNSM